MIHRSFVKVTLGLIITLSLLAVIGLFFMGSRPLVSYPAQSEDGPTIPPIYNGGWHVGARPVLCGAGLLLMLSLPLALVMLGTLFRRRFAGGMPCGPMTRKPGYERGHPWPWEEEELSEEEMKRMKHWHRIHGFKAPWTENSEKGNEKVSDDPKDDLR